MKSSQTPKMMTFKSFLMAQEDTIEEDEAVRRYHEYKTEFKRTNLSDFFVLHKDEEWYVPGFLLLCIVFLGFLGVACILRSKTCLDNIAHA